MSSYRNKKDTKRIGDQIKSLRLKQEYNIEDIAAMTGFSRSTISHIEKGGETRTSHLVEIAKAIGVHPKLLFDIDFDIKPRYKLTQKRKDQSKITAKIRTLLAEGYFTEPRTVESTRQYLALNKKIKVSAAQLSVVLSRLTDNKELKAGRAGRKYHYQCP